MLIKFAYFGRNPSNLCMFACWQRMWIADARDCINSKTFVVIFWLYMEKAGFLYFLFFDFYLFIYLFFYFFFFFFWVGGGGFCGGGVVVVFFVVVVVVVFCLFVFCFFFEKAWQIYPITLPISFFALHISQFKIRKVKYGVWNGVSWTPK